MEENVIKYCPNYNTIINFEFLESDVISATLINYYKEYIYSISYNDTEELKKASQVDSIIMKYINDYSFRNEMKRGLLNITIKKSVDNIINVIIDNIINIFRNYQDGATRRIYISRWI